MQMDECTSWTTSTSPTACSPHPAALTPLSRDMRNCPVADVKTARWGSRDLPGRDPPDVPGGGLGQGVHPLAGHGVGETHAVAAGLADVGVVQEPVDGGGGQCLGHQLV